MAKLLVGIAAHPKRQEQVFRLVNGPLWGLDVSEHEPSVGGAPANPRLIVAYDREDDPWDTHERAWAKLLELACLRTNTDATHALVLQDDAVLCRNLVPGLEMALDHIPSGAPASLYFGSALNHPKVVRAARQATENKASWIVSTGIWWGVAVVLPMNLIEPMLKFCSGRRENYDRRLTIWCEYNQHVVYYPWPSLVEHLDVESLINPARRPGRKAYKFVGEDFSALSFVPTGPTVPCGRISASMVPNLIQTRINRKGA